MHGDDWDPGLVLSDSCAERHGGSHHKRLAGDVAVHDKAVDDRRERDKGLAGYKLESARRVPEAGIGQHRLKIFDSSQGSKLDSKGFDQVAKMIARQECHVMPAFFKLLGNPNKRIYVACASDGQKNNLHLTYRKRL